MAWVGTVAVAANNATGDVYVLDSTDNVVDVFDSTGGYVCQITGAATPSASECNGVAGSDTPAHGFGVLRGIAVDQAAGEVFVVDARNSVVDVFSVGGAYVRQISLTPIGSVYVSDIAVDDFNGRVYLGSDVTTKVYEFDALSGAYLATWSGANTPAGSFGSAYVSVAAHNASGNVYVTDSQHQVTDVFRPGGEYLTQITGSATGEYGGQGTAVDQASGNVYVSDNSAKRVSVFGAVVVPDVVTGVASNVLPTSVTLNGIVNPDGVPLTECAFEYVSDAALRENAGKGYEELLREGFTAEEIFGALGVRGACEHPDAAEISGSNPVAVHAALAGLQEGVTYHYRLVAENANGANQGAVVEVTPPAPPSIDSASAENVVSSTADLRVSVNPHAGQTSYRFEYGTSTAYGTSVPVPEGSIPAGLGDRTVTQHVSGLQANTTYHWRVVVGNIAGSATDVDHTFVYDTSGGGLPDNRAYEMVTPPQKSGALIGTVQFGAGPDVAEDGSGLVFTSIQCFTGSVSCNANRGEGQGDPFVSTRTSGGWVTRAAAPPASQFDSNTYLRSSADAGTELFSAAVLPGGEDHLVAGQSDGSFLDIGPVTQPAAGALGPVAGEMVTTADLSHVVFQLGHEYFWPFDATKERQSLYEYEGSGTAPVLVGVSGGAHSTDLISTCGTYLGDNRIGESVGAGGSSFAYNSLSSDGSTVFFGVEPCASGSGVNAGVPVPVVTLYARVGGSRTVLISGRSPLGCTSPACVASAPLDAGFQGASADGSRVFFTSEQQLTDDASEGSRNLYEYNFSRPAGENLTAVSAGDRSGGGPQVQGVEAISSDGSHIYFVAKGVLTGVANGEGEVAQAGAENLYVFERDASYPQGRIAFIAVLPSSDREFEVRGELRGSSTYGVGLANVTPDGRFLVFMSHGRLTPDDTSTSGAAQVFRYDAQTGALVRISIGERGFNDNGNAGVAGASIVLSESTFFRAGGPRPDPTMSHDGSFVFFESPAALTPRALNEVPVGTLGKHQEYAENVYEWHEGQMYLISDGRDTTAIAPPGGLGNPSESSDGRSDVQLIGSDARGANVFFSTTDRLVPQDTDTQLDYYDARICTASEPCVAGSSISAAGCTGKSAGWRRVRHRRLSRR